MVSHDLVTGLGGAVGCSFIPSRNRLVFVEFEGKISRYDLVAASSTIISNGSTVLKGTFSFDFDTGTQNTAPGGTIWDVFWQQHTAVKRTMNPRNGAQIAYLGMVNFYSVNPAELQALTYTTTGIIGNDDGSNLLVNGAMFAVHTNLGNYAKVQVINYGYNLEIRWITYKVGANYEVLGTGYTQPEDVVVNEGGDFAFVTERSGNLLGVDLANANRAHAAVISSGMTAPHQIALDEAHGHAYVVEYARPGRLLRIDLATGAQTALVSDLDGAIGLLMTSDMNFAYVSEQSTAGGRISRIEISTGTRELLVSGLVNPFFLTWADPGEAGILTTERDPANRVSLIDLTQAPVAFNAIAGGVPARPSSVAVVTPERLLLCSNSVLSELDLTGSVYSPAGPLILGVGHVPVDRIFGGYADTTGDPGYFFQVKDAPFGGTLPLMINHTRAYAEGARYYRLFVNDGAGWSEPRQTWHDYRWSTSTNRFELQTLKASSGGYYAVRQPNQLWYNHWLGYRLGTSGLQNALCTIRVAFYSSASIGSFMANHDMQVMIDNHWPAAIINAILHDGAAVGTCGIVSSGSHNFSFYIIAHDAESHLKSWHLSALWGDNQSAAVASASYVPVPSRHWAGTPSSGEIVRPVPADPWHPINHQCAHTFYLTVWDRVINGLNYIHRSQYHKSITIMLP